MPRHGRPCQAMIEDGLNRVRYAFAEPATVADVARAENTHSATIHARMWALRRAGYVFEVVGSVRQGKRGVESPLYKLTAEPEVSDEGEVVATPLAAIDEAA